MYIPGYMASTATYQLDARYGGILMHVVSGMLSWSTVAGLSAFSGRQFDLLHDQSWTSVRFTQYV